jgi:GNAT superfamily N-acetyltransferase
MENQTIVGTGCYEDNHITRVYVLPEYQRNGYGSYILKCLEDKISKSYDKVCLDASLPACQLYEKRGYITTEHCNFTVDNDVVLVYAIMEKTFVNKGYL